MTNSLQRLRELRSWAERINSSLVRDLKPFEGTENPVFLRLPSSDQIGNVTTTCSCLMALLTCGKLDEFFDSSADGVQAKIWEILTHGIKGTWKSSGLDEKNAFSSLIVLRTVGLFRVANLVDERILTRKHKGESLREIVRRLSESNPEGFRVGKYPSTPALAYWFLDAIENLSIRIEPSEWESFVGWAAKVFSRHVSLVASASDALKDPVQLGMAACLASKCRKLLVKESFETRENLLDLLPTQIEAESAI